MKKVIVGLSFITISLLADSVIMPYGGYISYDNKSAKKDGFVGGAYASYANSSFKSELGYERLIITYNDTTREDLNQNDYTFIFTKYFRDTFLLRGGIHYIDTTDINSDKATTYILGAKIYEMYKNDFGLDLYHTSYSNINPNINVTQISPYYGFAFDNFYLKGTINYITFDKKDIEDKASVKLSFTNYYNKLTTSLNAMIGEEVKAISNDGFTVYNNSNVYSSIINLSFEYKLIDNQFLKLSLSKSDFEDEDSLQDATSYSGIVFYTYSF